MTYCQDSNPVWAIHQKLRLVWWFAHFLLV